MTFLLDKVLLDYFAHTMQLSERFMFHHVILEMATKIHLEQVTKVGYMVTSSCAHL